MKSFWSGFSEGKKKPNPKKRRFVIILFMDANKDGAEREKDRLRKISYRFPKVGIKVVDVHKDPVKPTRFGVSEYPTMLLLRDGREVTRATKAGDTVIEQLFRKANG